MPNFTIRRATAADAELLLTFIQELADAEAFPFPVTVTADDLRQSLFGPDPAAEAAIGYVDHQPAAFAVYFETFATTTGRRGLHMDDLFVRPAFQGEGYGQRMLEYVSRIAVARGCARLEWWVLRLNESAMRFYERMEARPVDAVRLFRLDNETLLDMARRPDPSAPR